MKKILSFFAIALLATGVAKAQSSDAVQIGSMTVQISLNEATSSREGIQTTVSASGTIVTDILIMRTFDGQTEYQMKASNIRFINADGTTDGVPTEEIINALAEAAVVKGYEYGYATESISTFWSERCIVRSGSGEYTRFAPCSSNTPYCWRDLEVVESPATFETEAQQVDACPDCTPTSFTITNSFN